MNNLPSRLRILQKQNLSPKWLNDIALKKGHISSQSFKGNTKVRNNLLFAFFINQKSKSFMFRMK